MIQDLQAGADNETQAADLLALADQLDVVRTELANLGMTNQSLTGTEMRDIQTDMGINGIPQWELNVLSSAGFGESFRDEFIQRHLDADLTEVESMTVGQALINARDAFEDRAYQLLGF